MFRARWLVGMLAAAMWVAPAAADERSASDKASDDKSLGDKVSDTASKAASKTKEAAGSVANKVKGSDDKRVKNPAEAGKTLAKLHDANQFEIHAGEAMKEHASSDKVKQFASHMVEDHSKMDQDLMSFAKDQTIDLTSVKGSQADKAHHQSMLKQLKSAQGAQADRQYMSMMVQAHQKDLKEVRAAEQKAKSQQDDKLAELLGDTAKKMEEHLKDAQDTQKSLQQRQARTPSSAGSDSSGSTGTGSGSSGAGSSSSGSTEKSGSSSNPSSSTPSK